MIDSDRNVDRERPNTFFCFGFGFEGLPPPGFGSAVATMSLPLRMVRIGRDALRDGSPTTRRDVLPIVPFSPGDDPLWRGRNAASAGRSAVEMEPRVRVVNLASGSSGNALVIDSGSERVLVDCGIGPRLLRQRLDACDIPIETIAATLISHEHIDHVRGLPAVVKTGRPVYCTAGTARYAGIPYVGYHHVAAGIAFTIGSLSVTPVALSHDAAEPCGFLVAGAGATVAVVTDTGIAEQAHLDAMLTADLIVVEANYDAAMLRNGPYPPHLKRRVASSTGHLCNDDCASLVREVQRSSAKHPHVWLAHLSETNNRPEIAEQAVRAALGRSSDVLTVEAMARHGGQTWRPDGRRPEPRAVQAGLPFTD